MDICSQRRLACAAGLQVFCLPRRRDVRGDTADRVRLRQAVPQQKLHHDVMSLVLRHRYSFLKLNGRARFDHISIIGPQSFGDIARMNVEIALPVDFIALDVKSAFILAIDQDVAQFEILDENDGCGVIQNILQALFACAKRLFCPSPPSDLRQQAAAPLLRLCALLFHSQTRKVVGVSCQDLFETVNAGASQRSRH